MVSFNSEIHALTCTPPSVNVEPDASVSWEAGKPVLLASLLGAIPYSLIE